MKIQVKFDRRILARSIQRDGLSMFEIAWKMGRSWYPSKNWLDCGAVILGWWLVVMLGLAKGNSKGKFAFMEGPYAIFAEYNRKSGFVKLVPQGLDRKFLVPFCDLSTELLTATNTVVRRLGKFRRSKAERAALKKGVVNLQRVIAQGRSK